MDDWVFGCDICQEVCPYNQDAPAATEPAYQPDARNPLAPRPSLAQLAALTEAEHAALLAGTAMKRAKLPMLQRNAAIALANLQRSTRVPLEHGGDAADVAAPSAVTRTTADPSNTARPISGPGDRSAAERR
jgi:epoxyqueuosine reductase QueG